MICARVHVVARVLQRLTCGFATSSEAPLCLSRFGTPLLDGSLVGRGW